MPWKEQNVMNLRTEFVLRAMHEAIPFAVLCQEYGISRKTGYKWKQRFLERGVVGLRDLSRRPLTAPTGLSEDVVCKIISLKGKHEKFGPRKIREVYARLHPGAEVPAESSFKRVLAKAGYVKKRRKRPASHSGHLKHRTPPEKPNDLWTVDFKGWWYTSDKQRCEPLTVRDAFSRFVLCVTVPEDGKTETIQKEFEHLFVQYGLPKAIRSDNGSPFAASTAPLGLSRISAWWVALGINLDRIDPGKPYQNGGHERMHLDIALEVEGQVDGDLECQRAALRTWQHAFNHERPHEALDMRCPGEVYQRSAIPYQGTPEQLDYPADCLSRKVNQKGQIKLRGIKISLSSALRGWQVGLRQHQPDQYTVHFGRLCLGWIDAAIGVFHHV